MPVTVKLDLQHSKLLYQQTTLMNVEIANLGPTPLRNLNPRSVQGGPTYILTDVATGDVSRHYFPRPAKPPVYSVDLPPKESRSFEESLTNRIPLPGAGEYDLQVHFEWNDGLEQITSEATRIEVRESTPRSLCVANQKGGVGPLFLSAWLNRIPKEETFELWLAEFLLGDDNAVENQILLVGSLEKKIEPILSIPPNTDAEAQWIVWKDDQSLRFVFRMGQEASAVMSTRLEREDSLILHPILENPPLPGRKPGADVVLYAPGAKDKGGSLDVLHLTADGKGKQEHGEAVPEPAPSWGQTTYLSDHRRNTFVVFQVEETSVLKVSPWNPTRPPGVLKELASWPARFIAAGCWFDDADQSLGALLGLSTEVGARKYLFYPWIFDAKGNFEEGQPIAVAWPVDKEITKALVRVDAAGRPFALLQTQEPREVWFFVGNDGSVTPATNVAQEFHAPADIVFVAGSSPLLLYTDPGKGFHFASPPGS